MEHKKAFLLKKGFFQTRIVLYHKFIILLWKTGLTNDEVELAVSRANASQPASASPVFVQPPPLTFWQRSRDSLASFVIFGGFAFAVYQFYQVKIGISINLFFFNLMSPIH